MVTIHVKVSPFFSIVIFSIFYMILASFSSHDNLTTNHYSSNHLIDNPHESNSLNKALLLQEPLMAHDDGF